MTKKFYFLFIALLSTITMYSQVSKDTVKVINLSDVQVTGIRPGVNTPISQKTITSLEISKDYHGQEMTYVLEKTPSVTTQSDGGQPNGYTYFRIRGIDQTRINVTLNGSPLNESEDQGAYYSNYPGFATYLKSVQVQRGVGTSSNGTSSYGGSINFESKDGLDKGVNGGVTVGSFNTRQINANYGTGLLKNKMAFFGGISTYSSDGYRQHSGGTGSTAFFSVGYFDTNDVFKLTGFTGISKNSMAWAPTPENLIKNDRTTNILSKDEVDDFNQTMVQLQYSHSFNKKSIITSNIYYNNLNGVYGVMLPNSVLDSNWYNVYVDTTKSALNYNLHSSFFGGYVNYKIIFNNIDVNIGTHMNTYSRQHIGIGSIINDVSYDNIGYKNEISHYIKIKYTTDKIVLFGDVQVRNVYFNYIQKKHPTLDSTYTFDMEPLNWGIFINPMGGITYELSDTEKLYTSIGLTHREPGRTDMFGDEFYNGTLRTNKVESVVDYEFGYNLNMSNLSINANYYYMYFNNQFLPTGQFDVNSLMIMQSVDKSFRTGIEVDMNYKPSKNLSLTSMLSTSNNAVINNDSIKHMLYSPNIVFNQNIDYTYKNFFIGLSVRYVSDSFINLNDESAICPSYATLNGNIGYENDKFILTASMVNITNTKYYTAGNVSDDGTKNYFVGTPISFYTSIKFNF